MRKEREGLLKVLSLWRACLSPYRDLGEAFKTATANPVDSLRYE
jgi:hypothetical protein